MNIGITVFPTYGGSGIVGSELGRELSERGHNVHFISYALPTRLCRLNERLRFHQVDLFDYPLFEFPPYDLALASKIVEVAENERLDVLHMHYAIPHATAAFLAREMYKSDRYLPVRHDAARHGHHAGRVAEKLPADHAVFDRAIRRFDRDLAIPGRRDLPRHSAIARSR